MQQATHLIIGAGPTGLGAAHRLRELGRDDFLILERHGHVGGLAASFTDSAGFTWDIGGHVTFSHYDYYDRLLDSLLGDSWLEHQRIARVRMGDVWVPYPFQNNIRHLAPELQWECVQGLLPENLPQGDPANFRQWMEHVFGAGITRLFMLPYNFKVWATPPEDMAYHWIGERVSVIDLGRVLKNLVLGRDDVAWGPNNAFRFPEQGGTGAIYERMADPFRDRIRLNAQVTGIDAQAKTVRLRDGSEVGYEHLLNTGPLDLLTLKWLDQADDAMREAAMLLKHNSVYVAGVGVDSLRNDPTCWMYFPESTCPYYRLTNFHNYSPRNVPVPGTARALMAETSFSEHKPEDLGALAERTVDGLVNTAMLSRRERDGVVNVWEHHEDYGYPVPTMGRNQALAALQPRLEAMDICSRGRFGGWRYEAANMDHSVMQGVEWAQRMVLGEPETTYTIPAP